MKLPLLALAGAIGTSACAHAQEFPSKPVRFVVGQAPGGATDIVARLVANKMTELFGQNIVGWLIVGILFGAPQRAA